MTIEAGRGGEQNEWAREKGKTSDGRGRGESKKQGSLRNSGEK